MIDAQKWFSTSKTAAALQKICKRVYASTRAFVFPSETRFAGKLLQIKRFLSMKRALQELVNSDKYTRFDFADDTFAERIAGDDVWSLMSRVTKCAGPILLLLRLGDSNQAALSKLKVTVDYISTQMVDSGEDTIEDQIAQKYHQRVEEFECDASNAAYIIDQQFVVRSKDASPEVMRSFWKVTRNIMGHELTDRQWMQMRSKIAVELSSFRMKTGGFACENYQMVDTCSFWGAAGCHAPHLKKIAFCLAPLPCSSGEAERNWNEVKQNKTKNRNRIGRDKLEKMVFVRRFMRLKRKILLHDGLTDEYFNKWITKLLSEVEKTVAPPPETANVEADMTALIVFQDNIEPGEQGRINGKEPGSPAVGLQTLKKDKEAKSWLFEKYFDMCFVDKNPEGAAEDPPLADSTLWEHRVIQNVVWTRRKGYMVETALRGDPEEQSIHVYDINVKLIEMIRASPHNVRRHMHSQLSNPNSNDADGSTSEVESSVDEDSSDSSSSETQVIVHV